MASGTGDGKIVECWQNWRKSGRLRDLSLFAVFTVIAAIFWLVLVLNDVTQDDIDVKVQVYNLPDTVTFINDPPAVIHVTVRDKGTALARRKFMQSPRLNLNFAEYASDGYFRVSATALAAHIRALFGPGASVNITSLDSISLMYTSAPAKFVPVRIDATLTPVLGKVINGKPRSSVREIKIYSAREILDTISYVSTFPIVRRNISDPLTVNVRLRPIKGVRMEPSSIDVTIPVEPLENRKMAVEITPVNVPEGETLALFPAKVQVSYLVPMSMSDDARTPFRVLADYKSLSSAADRHIKIRLAPLPAGVADATIEQDSVEYTIIRENKNIP